MEMSIKLTEQEWNIVGACLNEGKFSMVAGVIAKMNAQFTSQITCSTEPETAVTGD